MSSNPKEPTKNNRSAAESMAEVMDVIDSLLGPGGCPWDRKQTPQSLSDYILEESFELAEAVRADSPALSAVEAEKGENASPVNEAATAEVAEELGDVFFLLLFVARLYERGGRFGLPQVFRANAAKMIRRHPHVFEDLELSDRDELLKNWERIKREEKKNGADDKPGVFETLPKGLPPMLKAYRIHSKAARVGFTWETDEDRQGQLDSEAAELAEAVASGDEERIRDEFGDYLFTLIEYGRSLGVKANAALDDANRKFLTRFKKMEALARERGLDLPALSLDEKNALWGEVKKIK
jgi:ATP diphosphatase